MSQLNEAQIRAALQAAGSLSGRRHARISFAQSAAPGRLERQRDALFATAIAKTGWNRAPLEELLAQSRSEAARFTDSQRAAAGTRSGAAKESVRRSIDSRREALEQLSASDGVQYIALDTPFLIWPTHGISLESSQLEPWNSRAKFLMHAGNSGGSELTGHEELTFYFLWENPRDRYCVATVDGFVVLNGFCDAVAEGGILPGSRFSNLHVDTTLRLMEWWNQPPTEPPAEPDQRQRAVTLSVDRGGFADFTHVEIADVFRGYDLRYASFALPPHGVAVIEVSVAATYGLEDGSVDLNFSYGDFDVLCPFVQVALLP